MYYVYVSPSILFAVTFFVAPDFLKNVCWRERRLIGIIVKATYVNYFIPRNHCALPLQYLTMKTVSLWNDHVPERDGAKSTINDVAISPG